LCGWDEADDERAGWVGFYYFFFDWLISIQNGWMEYVYAPRFGLACHPSWRVSTHSQQTVDETGVRRGNLQRSCHVITRKGLWVWWVLYCTTWQACMMSWGIWIQDSNTTVKKAKGGR
jgi:hypothetical protein